MIKKIALLLSIICVCVAVFWSCGTKNKLESYSDISKKDRAKQALDSGSFDQAILLYKELITAEPESYQYYCLLAVTLSSRGGINFLEMVKNQISSLGGDSGEDSSKDVLDNLSGFIPTEPTDEQIADVSEAAEWLKKIPADLRTSTNLSVEYAASAEFQLTLCLSSSSLMLMNKYKTTTTDGVYDRSRLEQMTSEDVDAVLNNLADIVANAPSSEVGAGISEGVSGVLDKIQTMPGDTTRDKLINYIAAKKSAPEATPTPIPSPPPEPI